MDIRFFLLKFIIEAFTINLIYFQLVNLALI